MNEFRQGFSVIILRGIGDIEVRFRSGVDVIEGAVLHHAEPSVSRDLETGPVGCAETMDGAGSAT